MPQFSRTKQRLAKRHPRGAPRALLPPVPCTVKLKVRRAMPVMHRGVVAGLAAALAAALIPGCGGGHRQEAKAKLTGAADPLVRIVKPERRTIDYAVEQPGFVNACERTPIFSKVSGFIEQFYVDIGDEVKKGELLAEIFVPELDEKHQQRVAQVALAKQQVALNEQLVVVARSNVQMATAQLAQARADIGKYQAEGRPLGIGSGTLDANGARQGRGRGNPLRDAETTRFAQKRPATPRQQRLPPERPTWPPPRPI